MIFRESETVELKANVVEDIKKEIVTFANCEGGKLYIGVRDDGTVLGLDYYLTTKTFLTQFTALYYTGQKCSVFKRFRRKTRYS